TDELSGVLSGYMYFYSPSSGQYGFAWFDSRMRISGDAHDGVYQVTMTIPQHSEGGIWRADAMYLSDVVGNLSHYSTAALTAEDFPTELGVNINAPPVAHAGLDKNAIVGELLAFDGIASSDPDGSIASYVWAFGDGTSVTGSAPTHSYSAAGTFIVILTVTDDDGATATDTASVTVQAPAGAIRSLSALVVSYNLKQGIANSLDEKLQSLVAALEAANAGQRNDAANKLGAFINAVEAQRGHALNDAQADQLEALARRILAVLG
ncbi:MAG: PKD domain-containing protein, partial [Acidobacteria bacterium]|nr:PKD domain-containing protein [Acidobacteriota bacterium]